MNTATINAARPAPACPPGCEATNHDEERADPRTSWYFHHMRLGEGIGADNWRVEVQVCQSFDTVADGPDDPAGIYSEIPTDAAATPTESRRLSWALAHAAKICEIWNAHGQRNAAWTEQPCPPWCVRHERIHGENEHPADRGVWHYGEVTAVPIHEYQSIAVRARAFRHDAGGASDWQDQIDLLEVDEASAETQIKRALLPDEAAVLAQALLATVAAVA